MSLASSHYLNKIEMDFITLSKTLKNLYSEDIDVIKSFLTWLRRYYKKRELMFHQVNLSIEKLKNYTLKINNENKDLHPYIKYVPLEFWKEVSYYKLSSKELEVFADVLDWKIISSNRLFSYEEIIKFEKYIDIDILKKDNLLLLLLNEDERLETYLELYSL
ncbi:hypothetical protein Bp8pS_061 [Bacillus phage vB_BpuM-BpSp]|nr:hypothetical protein Bp8pS_061 [Bacillus phage vB_BpuM-BpSp]